MELFQSLTLVVSHFAAAAIAVWFTRNTKIVDRLLERQSKTDEMLVDFADRIQAFSPETYERLKFAHVNSDLAKATTTTTAEVSGESEDDGLLDAGQLVDKIHRQLLDDPVLANQIGDFEHT